MITINIKQNQSLERLLCENYFAIISIIIIITVNEN